MAKAPTKKAKAKKGFEDTLWDTANQLRGSVESSEYKHVVLSLVFLKFISDKFEARRQKMKDEGQGDFLEMEVFYQQDNIFYLPEEARWSFIKQNAKQDDIAVRIDTALSTIEKRNPTLKGALPDNSTTSAVRIWKPRSWRRLSTPSITLKRWLTKPTSKRCRKKTWSVACTNTSSASLPPPRAKAAASSIRQNAW